MFILSITEDRFEKTRKIIVGVMTRRDVLKDGDPQTGASTRLGQSSKWFTVYSKQLQRRRK